MKSTSPTLPRAWQEDIRRATDVMRRGGIILYPTDTIWGIGCDAENAEAVQRVYELKRRADAKALISLVDSDAKVQRYVRDVPSAAWDIIDCATSPITIIYDSANGLAPNLMAEDGSVAIRVTQEPFSRELCFRMQKAVVSTSANISGEPAPRCFDDISDELKQAVDYVCTSRRNEKNPAASSIVKVGAGNVVKIIRK
ncbi:MAG: threonylcarbamoyl-AMP synthase [Alloprevotella sp.]|nr:threonylcarbamoyl-AMP synthase [Alloprevotella sp.]MBR1653159.1 threonylcarbamoyl-AMP synthase [Alloprevotella sp.]